MKESRFLSRIIKLSILILLFNNFYADAQRTTIWIVNHAESEDGSNSLTPEGQQRALDLEKTLKHEGVDVIYVTDKKVSLATVYPLSVKVKLLPRVYTDSVQKFAEIVKRNFAGKKMLIVANYDTILPLLEALGAGSPFDALDKDDHDQLFTVIIKNSGDADCQVSYYGKKHHTNAIPQSYILDSYSPGLPNQ